MGTPALFEVRSGISMGGSQMLTGEGIPGGAGGYQDEAGRGSLYMDVTNGHFYGKKQAGSGADKWIRLQGQDDLNAALLGQSWRDPARLRDGGTYADLAAAETAVNTGTIDGVSVAEGDRILFIGITGENANVFTVTGIPGSGAALVEDTNTATKGDALYIEEGSSAGKQYAFNGSNWVWQGAANASEIGFIQAFVGKSGNGNETPDYPSTHVVTDGDSLEKAIGDLDAELGAAVTTPQARTVGAISDQALNRNVEALDDALGSNPTSTRIISAANPVNANLSLLDDRLADARTESSATGVTTAVTLDSVLVDEVLGVEWVLHVRESADPTLSRLSRITATHNGAGVADATIVAWNEYGVVKTGSIAPPVTLDVDLSGSGAAQTMRLRVSCANAVEVRAVRSVVTKA